MPPDLLNVAQVDVHNPDGAESVIYIQVLTCKGGQAFQSDWFEFGLWPARNLSQDDKVRKRKGDGVPARRVENLAEA